MKQLIIIGASGHGRVVADVALLSGYTEIVFLDDDKSITHCGKYDVVGVTSDADRLSGEIFIGIGNNLIRRKFCEKYKDRVLTLVHPNAVVASDIKIGLGSIVMAGTVINPGSQIGTGCIVNTSSSIDHDCKIGDYVHIAVGAHLSGSVVIGNNTWLGAGAVVSNNVSVCNDCIVGAGAVVIRNICQPGTYVGVPARKV